MNASDFEIIDCHIHPWLSPENNTEWFGLNPDPDEFVAKLKESGVNYACGSVVNLAGSNDFHTVKRLNREAVEFGKRYPDFFFPGIHVHPDYPENSCAEIEEMYYMGVRWIGELVAYIIGYQTYLPNQNAYQIYELAQDLGMVMNIHAVTLEEIENICRNFPKLNVVLAHPTSAKEDVQRRIRLIAEYPNLHLDTSGSGIQRWGMMRFAINEAGKEKILFGTDYPVENPAVHIQGTLFEDLNDIELEAVFSGNFKRLTGLP